MSAGVRAAKFAKVGDTISGTIVAQPQVIPITDPATGKTKTWDDGNPQMQMRVILETDQRDPDDAEDTGERAVYIKSGMRLAVAKACRKAGVKGLELGGKLAIRYQGDGEAGKGLNPPKLYAARYEPPTTPVPLSPEESWEMNKPVAAAAGNRGRTRLQQPEHADVDPDEIPF
jgi:hypothetical protein